MIYEGQFIQLKVSDGIAELVFDAREASVNMFNRATIFELRDAVEALEGIDGVQGLLVSSGKSAFIVGADIMEFGEAFAGPEEELIAWLEEANGIFNRCLVFTSDAAADMQCVVLGGRCSI